MKDKRYRLVHGESHEDVRIADDKERCYLWGFQVDRLNEYDEKCEAMEEKLTELGFELVFIRETWEKDKEFETNLTKTPNSYDNGEWTVVSSEEYAKFKEKQAKLI